jgi:hypothetical protein
VQVTSSYKPPLKRITNEEDWRRITAYPMQSSWPSYYYVVGARQIGLWPIPAQDVTLGLRVVYQPRAFNLSIEDITSTTTSATASVTQGSQTVTLSSGVLSGDKTGLSFQVTGVLDDTIYDITSSTSTTLTLAAPYAGPTASSLAWRVGQVPQLPEEFHFTPGHWALGMYFEANGNSARSAFHMGQFGSQESRALALYSSAGEASVITEEPRDLNIWLTPPPAA